MQIVVVVGLLKIIPTWICLNTLGDWQIHTTLIATEIGADVGVIPTTINQIQL